MNPTVHRILPPALVFGAATYFGWPPPQPLDLGDELVKAKAVRWHKDDLIQPPMATIEKDPFLPVLVAEEVPQSQAEEVAEAAAAPEPVGPTPEMIQAELLLTGIATMAGRSWAIINGRPRLPGDFILTDGAQDLTCEIISVHSDHVVVRCQQTLATIRPLPAGSRRDQAAKTIVDQPETPPISLSDPPSTESTPPA